MFLKFTYLVLACWRAAVANGVYVPASPTNSTDSSGLNLTETSQITMQWWSHGYGSYASHIATGSRRQGSTGISKGVLLHLQPDNLTSTTEGTNTPWIAFVSCDASPGPSTDTDIFTLAQSKGAVSAVLYSSYSETCLLAPDFQASHYASSSGIDIFVTASRTDGAIIDYQFGQLDAAPGQSLTEYDATVINASYADVTDSIEKEYPVSGGYLLTTLEAWNATEDAFTDNGGTTEGGGSNSTETGNGNQGSGAQGGRLNAERYITMSILPCIATLIIRSFCSFESLEVVERASLQVRLVLGSLISILECYLQIILSKSSSLFGLECSGTRTLRTPGTRNPLHDRARRYLCATGALSRSVRVRLGKGRLWMSGRHLRFGYPRKSDFHIALSSMVSKTYIKWPPLPRIPSGVDIASTSTDVFKSRRMNSLQAPAPITAPNSPLPTFRFTLRTNALWMMVCLDFLTDAIDFFSSEEALKMHDDDAPLGKAVRELVIAWTEYTLTSGKGLIQGRAQSDTTSGSHLLLCHPFDQHIRAHFLLNPSGVPVQHPTQISSLGTPDLQHLTLTQHVTPNQPTNNLRFLPTNGLGIYPRTSLRLLEYGSEGGHVPVVGGGTRYAVGCAAPCLPEIWIYVVRRFLLLARVPLKPTSNEHPGAHSRRARKPGVAVSSREGDIKEGPNPRTARLFLDEAPEDSLPTPNPWILSLFTTCATIYYALMSGTASLVVVNVLGPALCFRSLGLDRVSPSNTSIPRFTKTERRKTNAQRVSRHLESSNTMHTIGGGGPQVDVGTSKDGMAMRGRGEACVEALIFLELGISILYLAHDHVIHRFKSQWIAVLVIELVVAVIMPFVYPPSSPGEIAPFLPPILSLLFLATLLPFLVFALRVHTPKQGQNNAQISPVPDIRTPSFAGTNASTASSSLPSTSAAHQLQDLKVSSPQSSISDLTAVNLYQLACISPRSPHVEANTLESGAASLGGGIDILDRRMTSSRSTSLLAILMACQASAFVAFAVEIAAVKVGLSASLNSVPSSVADASASTYAILEIVRVALMVLSITGIMSAFLVRAYNAYLCAAPTGPLRAADHPILPPSLNLSRMNAITVSISPTPAPLSATKMRTRQQSNGVLGRRHQWDACVEGYLRT
ncbi:hypothetical protein NMY22_g11419 [Coprinellus aureogranulatus]|nr:hypothetical protein NMY22_g11419 [Coprinellus aureogranulatus]